MNIDQLDAFIMEVEADIAEKSHPTIDELKQIVRNRAKELADWRRKVIIEGINVNGNPTEADHRYRQAVNMLRDAVAPPTLDDVYQGNLNKAIKDHLAVQKAKSLGVIPEREELEETTDQAIDATIKSFDSETRVTGFEGFFREEKAA